MSFFVYVLQDEKGSFYKGMTTDVMRRFREHISGKTKTTKHMQGLKIVYTEEVLSRDTARKRELYLKSAAGRKFLKKKLSHTSLDD